MARTERKYEARPAVRENTPLLISLFSPPGGGKTMSALRLAAGIQQVYPGEIVLIDTEAGRALHYADKFKFQHIPFSPPFGSLDYLEVIRYASSLKPSVIIVDSMSHEHVGEGGYLMEHERWVDRMAGDAAGDYKRREALSMAAWAKIAPLRTQMIQGIVQIRGNIIFTFRAKEKTKPIKGPGGKTEIVDMGWMPQAADEILYEATASCMMLPRSGGVATWSTDLPGEKLMMKLPEQFIPILNTGKPLSEETGRFLAEWARGGAKVPQQPAAVALSDLTQAWDGWSAEERGINRAGKGSAALAAWWATLPQTQKITLKPILDAEWKPLAAQADATASSSP